MKPYYNKKTILILLTMQIKQPLISIVIPVYNTQAYLCQCLDGMLLQTFKDIEVLCVNDGSTDGSLQIMQEYAQRDSRIKVISQANAGQAAARNQGLRAAVGKYVMFCDSDDWYEPQMCETLFREIESGDVDFVMCDCQITYEKSRPGADYHYLKAFGLLDFEKDKESKKKIQTLVWNKIFKMSLLKKYSIFFPENSNLEDVAFIIKYVSVSRCAYGLENKLYNYRIRDNSVIDILVKDIKKMNVLPSFYIIYEFLIKHGLWQTNYDYVVYEYHKQLTWVIYGIDENGKQVFFDSLKKSIVDFEFDLNRIDSVHRLFKLITEGRYEIARKILLDAEIYKEFFFLNKIRFYKIISTQERKIVRHYIFNIRYLKIKTYNKKQKTYFFFIPVFKKRLA